MKKKIITVIVLVTVIIALVAFGYGIRESEEKEQTCIKETVEKSEEAIEATIVASGDILYHTPVLNGAKKPDGSYDFNPPFEYIKPLISGADLALGDFEGCISPSRRPSGYPMFNAPEAAADAVKNTGFDVMDLAHNHILDMGLEGAFTTKKIFEDMGIDTLGLKEDGDVPILVKDVNGIKVAVIGLCYGYNGMEQTISKEDYDAHMEDLNPENVEGKIKKAEEIADITVIMPQSGVEYRLEPTEEQKECYRKMVEWGADIIFGGHPHVPEPAEIIEKDGEDKFIIYSMGNLISNQRIETMGNIVNSNWTERGVIMEVTIEKKEGKTVIKGLTPHPTWVQKRPPAGASGEYRILLTEEYMPGGIKEGTLDENEEARVKETYIRVMELLNIDSELLKPAA